MQPGVQRDTKAIGKTTEVARDTYEDKMMNSTGIDGTSGDAVDW